MVTDENETIVTVRYFCTSESRVWQLVAIVWNAILLLCATVLAFQMRRIIRSEFNESNTLAFMIYSHFFFVVLRLIVFFLSTSHSKTQLGGYASLIYSGDIVATIAIYFLPKFFAKDGGGSRDTCSRWPGHGH